MSRTTKKLLGFGLGILFLWLALRHVDLARLPQTMGHINWWWLPAILVMITIEHLLRVWRWQVILVGRSISFWHLYAGMLLGYLSNNVLPARAGEFVRCFYLSRKGAARVSVGLGSVVVERFLDGVAVLVMLGFSLCWFTLPPVFRTAGWTALVFYLVVLIGLIALVFRKSWFDRFGDWAVRPFFPGLHQKLQTTFDAFTGGLDLMRHPRPFLGALGLSLLSWGGSMVTTTMTLRMFNAPGFETFGFPEGLLLISFLALGAMVPGSPGMAGIFEWCCQQALVGVLHVDATMAIGYALVYHLIGYLYILVVGTGIMALENLSLGQLDAAAEQLDRDDSSLSNEGEAPTPDPAPVPAEVAAQPPPGA